MSDTSIQAAPDHRPGVPPPDATTAGPPVPPANVRSRPRSPLLRALASLASLRLTVILFVMSLFLVFVGTLAQMDESINGVVVRYFRSFFVWVPFQLFARLGMVFFGVDRDTRIPGALPFPGGWLLGTALLLNLLAAHLVRFKLSWKRSGILLIHSGLILMMLGELWTGLYAVEGNMTIRESETANFLEHRDRSEIAIIAPVDDNKDEVVVVPDSRLRDGARIQHKLLPFDIEVTRTMPNSLLGAVRTSKFYRDLEATGDPSIEMVKAVDAIPEELRPLADSGLGTDVFGIATAKGVGVESSSHDIPSVYVTLLNKETGKPLGSYFLSVWNSVLGGSAQSVAVDGKNYDMALRFKRSYKPYSVYLYKVRTTYYPNTTKPKTYSSDVRLQDPSNGEDLQFKIYMNQPLRYQGETFYQSQVLGQDTTVLQVVKNRGWLLPYISCVVVALGMLIHFSLSLSTFLSRRALP